MTALNSEGLEKAAKAYDDALNNPVFVDCRKCQGTGYHHGFGETGHDPDWCLDCGGSKVVMTAGEDARPLKSAITAYLSALRPVDRLEVVAHAYVVEGECEQIEWGSDVLLPDDPSLVELTPISQASSVIAGLKEERDHWKANHDQMVQRNSVLRERPDLPVDRLPAIARYEARISSLEEENKRLREALKPFADYLAEMPFDLDNKGNALPDDTRPGWTYLTAGDFRRARQTLDDHNG
jgi:hypothetical protein